MNPTCQACGGRCCSFRTMAMSFQSIGEKRLEDFLCEQARSLKQIRLADGSVPDMTWYVLTTKNEHRALVFDCKHLGAEGQCTVYENRPAMCRSYRCEALTGEQTLEVMHLRTSRESPDWKTWSEPLDLADVTERVKEAIAASPDYLPPNWVAESHPTFIFGEAD